MITKLTPTRSARRHLPGALVLAAVVLLGPAAEAHIVPTAPVTTAGPAPVLYAADEGLPGDGRPPSPGPNDPDGPTL